MVYVIQVCRQLASRIRIHPDPARKLSANLYDIHHYCVYSEKLLMMERELSETCRVSFQNNFEKLVHLVGFIIRIALCLLQIISLRHFFSISMITCIFIYRDYKMLRF